jgi:hypothetical protein
MRTDRIAILALLLGGGCIIVDNGPSNNCNDGVRNGSETDIDCGGSCGKCASGLACVGGADCSTGVCQAGLCRAGSPIAGTPPSNQITVYRISPGAAISGVVPGTDLGYFITASAGGSYRLNWTGDSSKNNFYGSVWTSGHFRSMNPGCGGACPLEGDDWVSANYAVTGGERIDFDTYASTGIDGFDFVVDTEPAIFDTYISGIQYQDRMFFVSGDTGQLSHTTTFPFGLTTQ